MSALDPEQRDQNILSKKQRYALFESGRQRWRNE